MTPLAYLEGFFDGRVRLQYFYDTYAMINGVFGVYTGLVRC